MDQQDFLGRLGKVEDLIGQGLSSHALVALDALEAECGSSNELTILLFCRARALYFNGETRAALKACRKVLAALPRPVDRSINPKGLLETLRFVAEVSIRCDDCEAGLDSLESVVAICQEAGFESDQTLQSFVGLVYLNLSGMFFESQRVGDARRASIEAVRLLDTVATRTLWGAALATLATVERSIGNHLAASQHLLLAAQNLEHVAPPARGQVLLGLANLELSGLISVSNSETSAAVSFVELLDQEAELTRAPGLIALSALFKHRRTKVSNGLEAKEYINKALHVIRSAPRQVFPSGIAPAVYDAAIGWSGGQGDLERCRALAEEALAYCSDGKDTASRSHFLLVLAAVDRLTGNQTASIQNLNRAWSETTNGVSLDNLAPEEIWSYLDPHLESLMLLCETQFSFGDINGCWKTLQDWSALVETLTLITRTEPASQSSDQEIADTSLLIKAAVALLEARSLSSQNQNDAELPGILYDMFRKRWHKIGATLQYAPISFSSVNKADQSDIAVCHLFAHQETCGGVLAVGRERIPVSIGLTPAQLTETVADFSEDVRQVGFVTEGLLKKMTDAIWSPLEACLVKFSLTSVVLVPHGAFYFVPFQAFSRQAPNTRPRLITDEFDIAYSIVAGARRERDSWTPASSRLRVLLIASCQDVPNLAAERAVLKQQSWDLTIIDDGSVDHIRTVLTSKTFDVIHFIAHGFVEYAFPELSRIMLRDDVPLTVVDISLLLKFHGALIVLSSCESGMKAYHRADFGNSLLSACFQGGASSVLASSWPLAGVSGSTFFAEFYSRLLETRSLSKAYRAAQVRSYMMSADLRPAFHPTYWGSMALWTR
jgi:CHAT domain-containing protein/tetratricopeptide (TPR) repeat protein